MRVNFSIHRKRGPGTNAPMPQTRYKMTQPKTAAARTSSALQRRASAIALAFGVSMAAAQETAADPAAADALPPALGPVETLWKTNLVDAVLRLRTCPETGICAALHWVNPSDRAAFDYFGDQSTKKTFRPTQQDILGLCDYAPTMQFNQVAPNRWEGKLHMRGKGMTVNVRATLMGENRIDVVASKAFLSERDTWTRVAADDPRYPRCTAPAR
jgi:hypothetical protein